VDHVDGLYNPCAYLNRLQKSCYIQMRMSEAELAGPPPSGEYVLIPDEGPGREYDEMVGVNPAYLPFYIIVEKILQKGEQLPEDWPVYGTTGYNFMNALNGIFVETANAKAFDAIYNSFTRLRTNFNELSLELKKLVMRVALSAEINTLGHHLNKLSEKDRHTRDFTLRSLIYAIIEVIAFFPVYRSYVHDRPVKERDRQYVEAVIRKAKRNNPAFSASIFDFLRDALLLGFPETLGESDKEEWREFVFKFQQLTGPVMAKGVEDTAFYVYSRLLSLNEVGGSPERFGTSIEAFHGQNIERLRSFPHAMNASSTHDTKRSEDVRARIDVLSEIPEVWRKSLARWRQFNGKKRRKVDGRAVPSANEEYYLYQTLIGAWPVTIMDGAAYGEFGARIREHMVKALREAKINSSWINPDATYEEAVLAFIDDILDNTPQNGFLQDFGSLRERVAHFGMLNSLSQVVLKIASPGVPDFYQGTEFWDFSLVDPDNRRLVDFGVRITALEEMKQRESEIGPKRQLRELVEQKEDGRVKQYLVWKMLRYRGDNRALFDEGEYLPLEVKGERAENVCAFARRQGGASLIVAVPRFITKIVQWPGLPLGREAWGDSVLAVPFARAGERFRHLLTGEVVEALELDGVAVLPMAGVFADSTVAMLGLKREGLITGGR
jgi:(1->4)-alpha-D-glucan 1-alpha-D-glucosylmutase